MNEKITGEDRPKKFKKSTKKKVCTFCQNKETIDYKDVNKIKKFMTEKGKILPRRQTGVCSGHQRELVEAIKRARVMALLPFLAD